MWLLYQRFNLTPQKRRMLLGMAMILVLTSTRVQAAEVNAVVPTASSTVTNIQIENDAANRGIVVPERLEGELPKANVVPAIREVRTTVTSYNSVPGQTDSTPFITADGSRTRDGIVAANFLKFGTKVRFPDLYGDKVFEVHDRMNKRYTNRVDIWMEKVSDSKKFGIKHNVRMEILPK